MPHDQVEIILLDKDYDTQQQTSCLEALYKIASKGWFVETLQILLLKTTLLFYILLRAFL